MVNPVFNNLDVEFWVHPAKLGLAQPSLCMFHRTPSIVSQFLNVLTGLKDHACPAKRIITFAPCSRQAALRKLTLLFVSEKEDLKVMNIRRDCENAIIEMTEIGRRLLFDAFTLWISGGEDFGVSPRHSALKRKELGSLDRESGELWFWGPSYVAP